MLEHLSSILIFLPLLCGIIIVALPASLEHIFKWLALLCSLVVLGIGIGMYQGLDLSFQGYSHLENVDWFEIALGSMGVFKVKYIIGVDGLSLSMLILTGIVFVISTLASWKIIKRQKAYYSFYLLLLSSINGCFLAIDFFLFFLFFEFMLLPMYFLIGIWGGKNREYASLKFIIYTLVGSVLILIVLLALGINSELLQTGYLSFDFRELSQLEAILNESSALFINQNLTEVLFLMLLIGFGIKLPTVPLHTWLPDAHVEAPTPISVVLAGVLLKVGAYGFLRLGIGFFPQAAQEYATLIAILGLISVIYGALNALAQQDLKKLIAYSSVSHMGFVFIGFAAMNEEGINGGVFQMFSHGILSSMLFLIAGVVYDRTGNRFINNYRGLASKMPLFTFAVVVAFFGSLGLPGLSGFIGEFFSLLGAFKSDSISKLIPSLSVIGIVLAAAYLLWTLQRMFFGTFWVNRDKGDAMIDLTARERIMLFSLAALAILFGIYPRLVFDLINQSIHSLTLHF